MKEFREEATVETLVDRGVKGRYKTFAKFIQEELEHRYKEARVRRVLKPYKITIDFEGANCIVASVRDPEEEFGWRNIKAQKKMHLKKRESKGELKFKAYLIVTDIIEVLEEHEIKRYEKELLVRGGRDQWGKLLAPNKIGSNIYQVDMDTVKDKEGKNAQPITYSVRELPVLAVVEDVRTGYGARVLYNSTREIEVGTGKNKETITETKIEEVKFDTIFTELEGGMEEGKRGTFFTTKKLAEQVAACRERGIKEYQESCSIITTDTGLTLRFV